MDTPPPNFTPPDIFIDKNGDWYSNGAKVIHEKIFKLFNESLKRGADGGFFLQIGAQTCPVRVENTPFVVRGVYFENEADGNDIVWLILNDGRTDRLDPATLKLIGNEELRCMALNGFDAAFSPTAMSQLSPFLERDNDSGDYVLILNNIKYSL